MKLISVGVLKKNLPKKPMWTPNPQPPKEPQPPTSVCGVVKDKYGSKLLLSSD